MKRYKKTLSILCGVALIFFGLESLATASTITGKVLFSGAPPQAQQIKVGADAACQAMHPNGLSDDEVVVNANGTLKDVFVYVKEGLQGKTFPAPKTPVVFDQKGCQYSPKVFGIQVNQPLEIVNSDNTLHNVHSLPQTNQAFNLGMPIQGMRLKKTFTKSEVMVKIKCEVHPWMHAYAGVLDHPFYAVSDAGGEFQIKDLPAGTYVLEAWHAKYGVMTQNITVAEGETKECPFEFKA